MDLIRRDLVSPDLYVGSAGYDRVDGHVFRLLAGGTPIGMDQPACAYPAGVSQPEIEQIYEESEARTWFEHVVPLAGASPVSLVIRWEGLSWRSGGTSRGYIENARAAVILDGSDGESLEVRAAFGTPRFVAGRDEPSGLLAELPVRIEVSRGAGHGVTGESGSEETYHLTATGDFRPA